jgi:tetratricopeptide (TPR) repeat protein
MALGALLENQGKYHDAEGHYRLASQGGNVDSASLALLNLIDKQGRHAEAAELRKTAPYTSDLEHKAGEKIMPLVQAEIRKPWSKGIRKDVAITRPLSFAADPSVPGFKLAGWCSVMFILDPGSTKVSGYVSDSSGNDQLDSFCLHEAEKLSVSKVSQGRVDPTDVMFTFAVNTIGDSPEQRAQHRYFNLRHQLGWQEQNLGPEHPQIAATLTEAGDLLSEMHNYGGAEKALQKACEIWEKSGVTCATTVSTYQKYGANLNRAKRYPEAVEVLQKALKLAEQYSKPDAPDTMDCKRELAKSLTKCSRSAEAQSLLGEQR